MKTLYFDIDGTVLLDNENSVKAELGAGKFEEAVRDAGFLRLVCVGNFGAVAHAVKELGVDYDGLGVLFGLCRGAFQDETWLRSQTVLIADPRNRVDQIDFAGDWWYVDDLAKYYMEYADKADIFEMNLGERICVPEPHGDGRDVLEWLRKTAL